MTVVENAEITDIDQLVELRLAYLNEDYGDLSENVRKKIRQDLPDYFKRNLNQNIFGYLIKEKDKIIACAFLLVVEKAVSPSFITGRTGTVLNVYTDPAHRHKGYARMVMSRLLSDAVEKDLSVIELKATENGYHLYKSVGFTDERLKYHSMKWYNQSCKRVLE